MSAETAKTQYLKEVRRHLVCPGKIRKRLLADMDDSLCTFLEAHPDAALEDLQAHFGSPEDAADAYLSAVDPRELEKQLRVARTVRRTVITVAVIAVILFVVMVVIMILDNKRNQPVIEKTTIVYGNDTEQTADTSPSV